MYPYVLTNTHNNELFETELARIILAAGCPSLIQVLSAAIIEYIDRYKEKITSPVSSERWKYVIDFYWSNIKPKIPYDYNEAVSLIPKILQQNKNNFFDTLAVIRMFASYVFDPYLMLSSPCTKYGIDFILFLTQAKEDNIPKTEAWLQLPPFKSLFVEQNHRIDRAFYSIMSNRLIILVSVSHHQHLFGQEIGLEQKIIRAGNYFFQMSAHQ